MHLIQRLMLLEKRHYPFRRWPKGHSAALLFPGCNFPGQYPKTMAYLEDLCRARGVGVAYDCCGKPLSDARDESGAARSLAALEKRLKALGVERVYTLCPNCAAYLTPRLPVPVKSVYELLKEWGWSSPAAPPEGVVFRPCPDRKEGTWLREAGELLPLGGLRGVEKVPCCGLRHEIAAHGPEAGAKLCTLVREQQAENTLFTYCASCSGQFARHGCAPVRHLLPYLLGVDEAPDCARSFLNRMRAAWFPHRKGERP